MVSSFGTPPGGISPLGCGPEIAGGEYLFCFGFRHGLLIATQSAPIAFGDVFKVMLSYERLRWSPQLDTFSDR